MYRLESGIISIYSNITDNISEITNVGRVEPDMEPQRAFALTSILVTFSHPEPPKAFIDEELKPKR